MSAEVVAKGSKRVKLSCAEDGLKPDHIQRAKEGCGKTESTPALTSAQISSTSDEVTPKTEAALVVISSDSDSENDNIPLSNIKKEIDSDKKTEELPSQTKVKTEKAETEKVEAKQLQIEEGKSKVASEHLEQKDSTSLGQAVEKGASNCDSDSDDCIISQEDLLAKLGLNSVKRKNMKDPSHKEAEQNTAVKSELRRPLFCDRPKESIIELLKVPKPLPFDKNKRRNGEVDTSETLTNGSVDDCDSLPDSPLNDEEELHCKEKLIAKLKGELRNEEAKLLLLKKLYASQNDTKTGSSKPQKENVVNGKSYSFSQQVSSMAQQYKSVQQLGKKNSQLLPPPPPLKVASTSTSSTLGMKPSPVSIQPRILPKANKAPVSTQGQISKTGNASSSHTVAKQAASSASTGSAIGMLQNVISSMSNNLAHPTPLYPRSGSQGNHSSNYSSNQPAPLRPTPVRANTVQSLPSSSGYASYQPQVSNSSASQVGKQAAAKMALRKQLEKTLLQIPPPKPPAPEWSFIPSLNSPDFMTLMGLEEVVKAIAIKEGKANVDPLAETTEKGNPRVCSACGTDFTPGWRKKPSDSSGAIICEKCSTANVKKELKAEHTARLKAAFLKALKQEQEIEQKMNESTPIAPKPQQSQKTTSSSKVVSASSHHHLPHRQSVVHHHHQPVQPNIYHHHQAAHADSLLYQLQQQHLQQQQQELEAARRHPDVRWHPYMNQHHRSSHKPQHHSPFGSETDRQYLLDMIPSLPSRSLGYGSKY